MVPDTNWELGNVVFLVVKNGGFDPGMARCGVC